MIGEFWPQPKLVAGYHLSDATDFSGNGRTLTAVGSPSYVLGKFHYCVDFGTNGNNGLKRTDNAGLDLTADHAVIGWFLLRATPASGKQAIVYDNYNATSDRDIELWITNNSGILNWNLASGAGQSSVSFSAALNTWHHFALVQVGSNLYFYLDGSLLTSTSYVYYNYTTTGFFLGGEGSATGINGQMDESVLIQGTFTSQQIRRLYAWAIGKL